MKKLTDEQKAKYVKMFKGQLCPHCCSVNIIPEILDSPDMNVIRNDVECQDCGEKWADVYVLKEVQEIED